jgi:hypothetical protein
MDAHLATTESERRGAAQLIWLRQLNGILVFPGFVVIALVIIVVGPLLPSLVVVAVMLCWFVSCSYVYLARTYSRCPRCHALFYAPRGKSWLGSVAGMQDRCGKCGLKLSAA